MLEMLGLNWQMNWRFLGLRALEEIRFCRNNFLINF